MIYPKYIIEDDCLIIGRVYRHHQLADNKENVKGGGLWHYNDDTTIVLMGRSTDFGSPRIDDVRAAVEAGNVYSNRAKTHKVLQDKSFVFVGYLGERTTLTINP